MKVKVTKKEILESYCQVISVGYCDLWYLLKGKDPNFYTCGVYGWNADIYDLGNGIALVTGYRPFGNIKASFNRLTTKYNEKAREIWHNGDIPYDKQKKKVEKLLDKFVRECMEFIKQENYGRKKGKWVK